MRSARVLSVSLLLAALLPGGAACTRTGDRSGNVVLGVPTALGAIEGQDSLRAAQLAVAEINAAGGVEVGGVRRKLEIASIDTRESEAGVPVNDALAAMEKLLSEKKPAAIVIGSFRSEVLLSAMDMIAKVKIPYLCTIGMSPDFEKKIAGEVLSIVILLMAVTGLVLLIACGNVANLMLARAASRGREIGIRLALGATRGRLIRQLLTESLLLSLVGGAVGFAMASWGTDLLLAFAEIPNDLAGDMSPDLNVFSFTLALAILSGVLAGQARGAFTTRLKAAADAEPGVRLIAFDTTIDGRRLGEWFDCIVEISPAKTGSNR